MHVLWLAMEAIACSHEQFHIYNKIFILSGIWKLHYETYYQMKVIFCDSMQLLSFTNTNVNMNVLLCNYLIELNFKCSWFWTTWKFFLWRSIQLKILLLLCKHFVHIKTLSLYHIRTYKHDRKRKLHYKMSHWSCQNNFGCIIIVANNPTATYFCWHSTKCERYLPQFALKYSHRHKDLIG